MDRQALRAYGLLRIKQGLEEMIKEPDSYANGPEIKEYYCSDCGWEGDENDLEYVDDYHHYCPKCGEVIEGW